jgi:PiT family inorganic phosphate transporter
MMATFTPMMCLLAPRKAVLMAAIANFISAFLFSTAVAATIGKGIIEPSSITSVTILAGLIAACVWNIITWYLGLPISSSHALIGSLIGAAYVQFGARALIYSGIIKTLVFIVLAPMIGFAGAVIFTIIVTVLIRRQKRSTVLPLFNKLQIISSFLYSLGHGTNDAQKTMGIISLTLFANHMLGSTFYVPVWVILSSHAAIAAGTYLGGWKIVKTMATKLIHLRPFEGFCAETSSAVTLFISAHFGIPVSTTHVINGSIIGVGATENYKKVKWITTRKILIAWILTIPISFLFGAVSILLIQILL